MMKYFPNYSLLFSSKCDWQVLVWQCQFASVAHSLSEFSPEIWMVSSGPGGPTVLVFEVLEVDRNFIPFPQFFCFSVLHRTFLGWHASSSTTLSFLSLKVGGHRRVNVPLTSVCFHYVLSV